MKNRKRIVILQRWLMHYRIPFFRRIFDLADEAGLHIELLYGEPTGDDRQKKDWFRESPIPGSRRLEQWRIGVGEKEVIWHRGVAHDLAESDLIVSQQENRILVNHVLALMPRRQRFKLAWWGHGFDFQAGNSASDIASSSLRRFLLTRADWFFAYTSLSTKAVQDQGFPSECITTLNNTIDVDALLAHRANVTETDVRTLRTNLKIPPDARIGVFIGGLYPAKRLELLLEAGQLIRDSLPNFTLVVGGSGVQEPFVREAARQREWLKFVGPVFERDKAVLLATSSVWLNPGLVGLAVVDALAVGIPMVTTTYPHHSPEIVYLRHNENGIVTEETPSAFAAGALRVLNNESLRHTLAEAGQRHVRDLTIDRMARNFLDGARSALAQRHRRQDQSESTTFTSPWASQPSPNRSLPSFPIDRAGTSENR